MNQAGKPEADGVLQAANTAAQPCILVVEDSDDIRYLLMTLLQESYEVKVAANGQAGLEVARATPRPDIILLDVMMPDMDGYEVLAQLGRDPRTADIPVIFLTALGSVEEEHRGLELGATDYVAKPISPPILLARLKLHVERSANAKRLKELSEQLSRYLAPQVYQSLFDGSRQAEIRTQRKKLTVFFSDIKNFTESTAQWQPEEVTLLLNSYFAEMSQIAAEYGATLDKFIGDAIVIFFGDPHTLGVRQDAVQCVRMAIAMQKRMEVLRARWRDMGIHKSFEVRIGINSGFCDVGNFGSSLRMEYTIIGREVNLAARLEQAADPGEILISSETYALVQGEIHADARDPVLAKGFSQPIPVFAVHPDRVATGEPGVLRADQPGLRLEMDTSRLTAAQKAAAAVELRKALASLEGDVVSEPSLKVAEPAIALAPALDAVPEDVLVLPERIAGLDLTLGLHRAMGVQKLYLSMLGRFLEGRRDTPDRVRQAMKEGDLKAAELLVHSLRGISAQIGATRVPEDALALEQALHEERPQAEVEILLGPLESSLGELIAGLQAGLPPAKGAAS
ncbi:adenylate/guanylate cyclase domain-containing protein [Polaromonas sp. A23]|uniref:adenylate/guanylate cyclase domain-containing protein n=1 Tax=Polaromonas sp. A23 TaxID=1944133 RepID=UPI0009872307|nr:adenylate/guanylate cyclase domain-containing protein [Polaromonas sp. A23]OOG46500.1 guanylate cyclase [Polaromonas sp. A23]